MKKLTCVILCLAMLVSFAGCGQAKYYTDGYIKTAGSYTGHAVTVDETLAEHTMRYQLGSYANASTTNKLEWIKIEEEKTEDKTKDVTTDVTTDATADVTTDATADVTTDATTDVDSTKAADAKDKTTYTDEELTVTMDDIITMDFTGYIDGKTFDGGTAKDYVYVMGSYTFIDGFDTGMNGQKLGEEFELKLKFPDDYSSKDLAGKDVTFKVTIKGRVSVPTTDENVKKYLKDQLGVSTVQELKDYVVKEMYLSAVLDEIVADYELSADGQAFVDEYIDYYETQIQSIYTQYSSYESMGIDSFDAACQFYTYYYLVGTAYDWAAFQEYINHNWKMNFILFDIADREGLVATDADIKQYAKDEIEKDTQGSYEKNYGITSWKGYLNYFGTTYVQFIATLDNSSDDIYQLILSGNSYELVKDE